MNNRQKRLCRALLEFYDASGAEPCPLAHLSRKTGYDVSDIYDKDSESGDLWPFDSRARGNLTGLLSFSTGKNPSVRITTAGLVTLEKLCGDNGTGAGEEKTPDFPKSKPVPVIQEKVPPPPRPRTAPPQPPPVPTGPFSKDDIADARSRFKYWLKSEEALKTMLGSLDGKELIDAAFDKFFAEFLKNKNS